MQYFINGISTIIEYAKNDTKLLIRLKETVSSMLKNGEKQNTGHSKELITPQKNRE